MPAFIRDTATLAYDERGDAAARAVVLVHGLGHDSRMWHPVVAELAGQYHVIAPDLPGHGGSSLAFEPAQTLPGFAQDVIALLDHLEVEACALAGWEMGATVAVRAALAAPDRVAALALLDPVPGPTAGCGLGPDDLELASRRGPEVLGDRRAGSIGDPFLAGAMRARYRNIDSDALVATAEAWGAAPLAPAELAGVAAPVLLAAGRDGPAAPHVEFLAPGAPNARLVLVRDAAGPVALDHAGAATRALREFFADVEAGRPVAGEWTI